MTNFVALDPVSPGSTHLMDFRYRAQSGERSVLPDSTRRSPDTNGAGGEQQRFVPRQENEGKAPPVPSRSGSSDFAAAVLAGALPPTPQSMNELIRRIGASEIPEESQARLKDLTA